MNIIQLPSSSFTSSIQLRRRQQLPSSSVVRRVGGISTSTQLHIIDPFFSSSVLAAAAAAADSTNLFQGALSIYKQHLLTEPLKTKVLTGVALAIVGDALAQYSSSSRTTTSSKDATIIAKKDEEPATFKYNVKRAISFATFDGCYRAVQQVTYPPMMKICNGKFSFALLSTLSHLPSFPSSSLSIDSNQSTSAYILHILASFEQTLVSQLLIIPLIYYPTFYMVTSFVQGLSYIQTINRIKTTFIPLMKRNLLFWIPIQFITFAFVDEERTNLQIPILIGCGLVWTIILSITAGATTNKDDECKKEKMEEEPKEDIVSETNEEHEETVTTLLIDMPTTNDDGNNNDEEDLDVGGVGRGGGNTNTTYTPETLPTTTTTPLRQTTTTTITSLRMKQLSFITFASIMSCNAYAVTTTVTTTPTTRRLWRNNIITPSTSTTKTGIPRSSTTIVRRLHPVDDEMSSSSNTNQVKEYRQDGVKTTLKYNIVRTSALLATLLGTYHLYLSTSSSSINLFERYNYLLKYKPLRTKVITGATLAVLGDGIAQLRSNTSQIMNVRYNPRRAISFATFDGCYRIFQHMAFPYIISLCQGQVLGKLILLSTSTTTMGGKKIQLACAALERTLVYQLLVIPLLYYPIFFTFTGYIQGLSPQQILVRAQTNFLPCWKRNLLFWIPCQFIMFSIINERWQIPFACLLGMLWSSILSITAGNANNKK